MTFDEKFYPGLNKVLVVKKDMPAEESGLVLSTASTFAYGTIAAVGAIKDGDDIDSDMFNVGDNIYFLPQSGVSMTLDGQSYRLMNITEILVGERNG